jgi:hypothetical protein
MHVVFGEAGTTLAPSPRESYPQGIEYRGLTGVILADKDRSVPKLYVEVLDRPKVFNSEARYAHYLPL